MSPELVIWVVTMRQGIQLDQPALEGAVTSRLTANVAGLLWLSLAFPLFFLTVIAAALVSEGFVLFAAMGIVAVTQSVFLFVRGPSRRLFLVSTALGLMFATAGVVAYFRSQGTLPGSSPVLVFVAMSTLIGLVSLIGSRARS
jgi:hypothetical protein